MAEIRVLGGFDAANVIQCRGQIWISICITEFSRSWLSMVKSRIHRYAIHRDSFLQAQTCAFPLEIQGEVVVPSAGEG